MACEMKAEVCGEVCEGMCAYSRCHEKSHVLLSCYNSATIALQCMASSLSIVLLPSLLIREVLLF